MVVAFSLVLFRPMDVLTNLVTFGSSGTPMKFWTLAMVVTGSLVKS